MSDEIPAADKFRIIVDDLQGRMKRRYDAMDIIDCETGLRQPREKEAFFQLFFDLKDDIAELGKTVREYVASMASDKRAQSPRGVSTSV